MSDSKNDGSGRPAGSPLTGVSGMRKESSVCQRANYTEARGIMGEAESRFVGAEPGDEGTADRLLFPGLERGEVAVLFGPGASGKSFFILQAMAATATFRLSYIRHDAPGEPVWSDTLGLDVRTRAKCLYISAEDRVQHIGRRFQAIEARLFGWEAVTHRRPDGSLHTAMPPSHPWYPGYLKDIKENLIVCPFRGLRLPFTGENGGGALAEALSEMIGRHRFEAVVFDPLVKFHELDEYSSLRMSNLMSQMEWIADRTGAAIVLVHRTAGNGYGSGDSRRAAGGASAIIDNVGFAANLRWMSEDEFENSEISLPEDIPVAASQESTRKSYVCFNVVKQNHGRVPEPAWFFRGSGGVLVPGVRVAGRAATRRGVRVL
ncbi:MAG: helicase RepA family protein [Deltaproteobacteria bacterium]|jgi:hypothetical protein|nr:helicase RepA family protein [Deltaproteobacteria bacterium]